MKKIFLICTLLLFFSIAFAHPGIGLVKDSKGNIFYTDLEQVWKIRPDGDKTIVVKGVHTHELYIDEQDNLYGEHLWYNGEAKDTWGHYAWCLKNNGELVKEIEPTAGFLTNYSFVRDSSGNMYWVERFTTSRIMKKNKTGEVTKIIEGKFGFIGWLFGTRNGTLYFTENNKLHRLSPNSRLETIAENIGCRSTDFTVMGRNYDSYGIWTDAADNVYLAMPDARKVIRISSDGKPETILNSNSSWMITSGLFDNAGNMWVLENSVTNEVRVRKIDQQNLAENNAGTGTMSQAHLRITIFVAAAVVILFFITRLVLNKRKHKTIQFSF
jgi:hypothetical protein